MFEKLNQEQFEIILGALEVYAMANPNKDVYLNEKCAKEAIHFMNTTGRDFATQLGINKETNITIDENN